MNHYLAGGLAAAALVLTPLAAASPATAQADPGLNSTYDFSFALYGSHYFSVVDRPQVTIRFTPTAGGDEPVTVGVQEADCGRREKHCTRWKTVAQKVVYLRTGKDVTVRLRVALSSRAHHITLTKQEDGVYYQGGITIR